MYICIQLVGQPVLIELSNLTVKSALSEGGQGVAQITVLFLCDTTFDNFIGLQGKPYKNLTLKSNIIAFKVNAQKLCQKMCNTHECVYMPHNYSGIPPFFLSNVFRIYTTTKLNQSGQNCKFITPMCLFNQHSISVIY